MEQNQVNCPQKDNWSSLSFKERLSYSLCVLAFIGGCLLTIGGFFAPPTGEISPSVISTIGIWLAWSGSVLGISTHYGVEMQKFKTTIENKMKQND